MRLVRGSGRLAAMKSVFFILLAVTAGAGGLQAQTPVVVHSSKELGFSTALPADWQIVDTSAAAQEQARQNAQTDADKKGLTCVQVGLMARHGTPPSVITEVALPFACYGQKVSQSDLPNFASGASEGLQQNLDLGEPVLGSYALGSHPFWIERVIGTLKGQPSVQYTIEIACSVTKKAAVCWMTMAANDSALATFEHTQVTLEGEGPAALVPESAFTRKPS